MRIEKFLITLLNVPRFLFHIILFVFKDILSEDVKVHLRQHEIFTPKAVPYQFNMCIGYCYLMTFDKTFRNLFYYRIGKWKYLCYYWAPPHNSFVISTYSKIGKGFLGVHPIGTFVNAKEIGEHFVVRNNVTIGQNHGIPTIKNNVSVNANSVIVGDITIGNNVVIGAGTVLLKSVPDNCVVVGNPAHILYENSIRVNKSL